MKKAQRWMGIAGAAAVILVIAVLAANRNAPAVTGSAKTMLAFEDDLAPLATADAWLNSPPLAAEELRGKVVLVQFWTYSCINWLRTLPHLRAWEKKYKDKGLVVVGVHTPEFEFEKDVSNIRQAATDMMIGYPIAIDSDYSIWRAFNNRYWPALYFIDARGRIRHHQFGEGEYEQSERMIQKLLAEAGQKDIGSSLVSVEARGIEVAADWKNLKSGENYVGYGRTQNFASPGSVDPDNRRAYSSPSRLALNHWSLAGDWTVKKQFAMSNKAGDRISYRFHARDLHLVMGPKRGTSVRFRVSIDGQPPGSAHGVDVDEQGNGVITEQRLYQLIRQSTPIMDRTFEIEFLDPGAEAFAFTFG
jgi:thiol-disulfide isomerase/thioredoxin